MTFTTLSSDGSLWKSLMGAVNAIKLTEFILKVDPKEGVTFRSMDQGHVALIDVVLPPESFSKFEVAKAETISLVVSDLTNTLERLNGKEPVEVSLDDTNTVKVSGRSKTGGKLNYKLHTIDPDQSDCPLPKLALQNLISIPRATMLGTLGDIAVVSDGVRIAATKDLLAIWGKTDRGEANKELVAGEEGLVLDVKDESAKCGYSLTYLNDFLSSQSADKVNIWFSNKTPIKIDVLVGEGRVTCYLAPRMDEI